MANIKYPCIADIKYDGMPVHVTYRSGMPLLLTTEAGLEYSMPHLGDIMAIQCNYTEFIAEWVHGEGKNNSIWSLLSARQKDLTSTTIKIFDFIGGVQDERKYPLLTRITGFKIMAKPQFWAQSWNIDNLTQLSTIKQIIQNQGYEGLVVKNLHESFPLQRWVKIKLPSFITAEVTKVDTSRIEINFNGVRVGLNLPGFPVKIGDIIEVRHYGVTEKGSLRNGIGIKNLSIIPKYN